MSHPPGARHIAVVSLAFTPFESGAETAVREVASRLARQGWRFSVLTLAFDASLPREEEMEGIRVIRIGNGASHRAKARFLLEAAVRLRHLSREDPFIAMWAVMTYMLVPVVLAYFGGVRTPWLLSLQDGDPYETVFRRWWVRPMLPILDYGLRHARVVHAISSALAQWPKRRGREGRVEVIPNAVDEEQWNVRLTEQGAKRLRSQVVSGPEDIVLFNAARLVHQKGHDIVLHALTQLPPRVRYVVAGGGPDRGRLESLAQELGVAERVVFLGQLPRHEVARWRHPSVVDFFVGPSRSEGLGNSFLSAMAAGLPVVATQVGGLRDILIDARRAVEGATGWAVRPEDPEDLARTIRHLIAHPEEVRQVATQAQAWVQRRYRWERIAQEMEERCFLPLVGAAPTAS